MKQQALFSKKQLKQIAIKKVWNGSDSFPCAGKWKGKSLAIVAAWEPLLLEKWIINKKICITPDLQMLINQSKYLAQ